MGHRFSINENCFGEVSVFLSALSGPLQQVGIHPTQVQAEGEAGGGVGAEG